MSPSDKLLAVFLLTNGLGGTLLAVLKPWQEHLEWGLRIMLLLLSLAATALGLIIAWRKRRHGRAP